MKRLFTAVIDGFFAAAQVIGVFTITTAIMQTFRKLLNKERGE